MLLVKDSPLPIEDSLLLIAIVAVIGRVLDTGGASTTSPPAVLVRMSTYSNMSGLPELGPVDDGVLATAMVEVVTLSESEVEVDDGMLAVKNDWSSAVSVAVPASKLAVATIGNALVSSRPENGLPEISRTDGLRSNGWALAKRFIVVGRLEDMAGILFGRVRGFESGACENGLRVV